MSPILHIPVSVCITKSIVGVTFVVLKISLGSLVHLKGVTVSLYAA